MYLEKPLGIDIEESKDLVKLLEETTTPNIVNFGQASCEALQITKEALSSNRTGPIKGVDIIMQYQQWPRSWQVTADWLRFRNAGGYVREVLSHFIFVVSTASLFAAYFVHDFCSLYFPTFIKQISKPLLGPLLIDFGVFYSRCVLSHISYLLLFTYSRKNHARLRN